MADPNLSSFLWSVAGLIDVRHIAESTEPLRAIAEDQAAHHG